MIGRTSVEIPPDCAVCSFDVFDTLLYRRSGQPETVFAAMERGWQARFGAESPLGFASIRSGAERRVRSWLRRDAVTIDEIYCDVLFFLGALAPPASELIAFEKATEHEVLLPLTDAVSIVERSRDAGKRVVFVSDMYLPTEFIRGVLVEHGIMRGGDLLFVSEAVGVTKASGALFRHVQAEIGLPPHMFFHIGDSASVDVESANRQGWQATRWEKACWTNRENFLWHEGRFRIGLDNRVGGAARTARLGIPDYAEGEAAAVSIGAAVAGPLLTAYSVWLLEEARTAQIDELFFLSRDGQVVFEVCRILAMNDGLPTPKLTYLYGSRQVWAFYALQSRPAEEQVDFFADMLAHASDSLFECLELLDLASHPELVDWSRSIEEKLFGPFNRESRQQIYRQLLADQAASMILNQKLRELSQLYLDYLRGMPIERGIRYGIVDIGWSGRWTVILADMFEEICGQRPIGFQMGRISTVKHSRFEGVRCFLFDQLEGVGISDVPGWFVPIVETFCGADHGRVKGMLRTLSGVAPVESASKFSGLPEYQFRLFRAGVTGFAEEWAQLSKNTNIGIGERAALVEVCRALWEFPSSREAALIAMVEVGMAPTKDSDRRLLRPYRWKDLFKLIATTQLPGYEPHWWHEGALAVTPLPLRFAMFLCQVIIQTVKAYFNHGKVAINLLSLTGLHLTFKRARWLINPDH